MSNKFSFRYLSQAWLVLILAILYGGGLAFVNTTLSPKIAENIKNETYSLIPALVGNPEAFEVTELTMPNENGDSRIVYQVTSPDAEGIGWVLPASALGFADRIQVLVGTDYACTTILSMRVIDQKETPGLGNLIVEAPFRDQFQNKATDVPIEIVKMAPKKASEVTAVTGATVSCVTVADAVNEAIRLAKPFIAAQIQGNTPTER